MTPKLLLVKSTVWTCTSCKAWFARVPSYVTGEAFGKGDYCMKCGCTSIQPRRGRPFGPKSRQWNGIQIYWRENWEDILKYDSNSVKIGNANDES